MNKRWKYALLVSMSCGCGTVDDVELGLTESALSACEEVVPADRFIDGVPAYAQCPASENSAIFSNDGVNTSLTMVDASWTRTQYSGGYQCTELATRYWRFVWNVRYTPRGNAGTWCDTPPPANSGIVQTTAPVHGDMIVFAPGSCGAAQGTGHVAVVDTVDTATQKVSVVEQNRARRGSYNISCGKCFLHVVANDGKTAPKPVGSGDSGVALPPVGDPRPPSDAGAPAPLRDAAARPAVDASARDAAAPPVDAAPPNRRDAAQEPPVDQTEEPSEAGGEGEDEDGEDDDEGGEQPEDDEGNADPAAEGCAAAGKGPARLELSLVFMLFGLLGRSRRSRKPPHTLS